MRMVKFSLVGVLGLGVQLAVLAGLSRVGTNYLVATVCGVEAAVLNNFYWHTRFTWHDRDDGKLGWRFVRFHGSNAIISLLGNVGLMPVLVGRLRMNLILGNIVAVSTCALLNYLISDLWVFTLADQREQAIGRGSTRPTGSIAHQNQGSLGKRNIEERRRGGQRQTPADLSNEEERGQGPECIEKEEGYEDAEEPAADIFHVEGDCREQVQPHRDTNGRRYDGHDGDPSGKAEYLFHHIFDSRYAREGSDIEAYIHDLDQEQ